MLKMYLKRRWPKVNMQWLIDKHCCQKFVPQTIPCITPLLIVIINQLSLQFLLSLLQVEFQCQVEGHKL